MIPTLYDKTGNNKIGDLNDCIECFVEEERNGIFELTMIYPANSSILESIVYDNIIVADANDYLKSQKFRVYNTRKLMANRIEVCARHISFDLVHDWVDVISIENQSCEYALNTIFRNSQFSKHFKGHSDIVNAQNFKVNKVTCLEAIGGTSGSILDTYGTGAEILRDNTDIHVLNRRGRDNDVVIEYRKNLTGLEVEEDTTDLVTRIMPYAIYTNSNNEEIEVRGDFIDSPLINNYAHPYVKYMDYSKKFEDDEVPTKTKLNNLAAKEYINNKVDIPKNNYKIEFIPLSKCAGYENLEDRINLCDVVTIKDSRYNIDTQAKVIKVVFDVLRGRYDSMELGEPRTTLGDIIGGTGDGPTQGPPGPPGPQGPAGADGSIGDFPETLPEVPNITAKVYGFANIELSWTFENKVYYSYELYASKTKGFTPNTFNLIFSGQASTYLFQAEPSETWYFRACALNTHGQRTEFSSEVEVSTVKISDLSNYVESAAIGDALIGELNLGRGWYGELKGNYIDAKQLSVTDGDGKRTLDIDSFGNVNLDVASIKIKSQSVATEKFVGNELNHYSTTAEMSSAIEQSENRITNIVSKTYYTKNDIDSKGFATTSQLQQTEQEFIYKFSQQGAVNLIYNGSPALDHSECWEAVLSEFASASQNGVLAVKVDSQNHGYAYNRIINVMPNVKYSIQYEVYPEVNTNGCGVWLIGYQDEQATSNNWSVKLGHHQPINAWHKNQITVTIPADVSRIQIRIDHLGIVDGNNQTARAVFFTKFQVREGDSFYPEWSPNPNETYNAVTKITPEGMSIYDGKIEILNQQSKKVFWVDNTGQLCTDNIYIFGDERAGNIDIRGTGNKGIGIRSLDAGDRYIDFTTLPIGESFEDYQNSGTFTRLLAKEGNFYILPTKELLIHSIRRDTNYLEKVTVVANQTNVTGNLIVENAVQTPNVITNLIRPIDGYETISIRGNVDGINLLKVEDVFRTATLYHRDGNGERDIYVGSNLNMNRLHVINAKLLNCEIINTYSKEYDTILSEGYGTLDETTNTVALDCFKSTEQLIKENLELRERQLEHDELIVNTAFELAKLQLEVTVGV